MNTKENTNNSFYIAIMAGGIGSRFWPASTVDRPKQFLDILGVGKSLIRMTFERCLRLVPPEHILIVTNKRYKELVMEHLPELPERNILCEPSMNNTAPCVAYTALRIEAENPNATFAVLPSDHVILKEEDYVKRLEEAFDFASQNEVIVTLGIKPTRPDTGYGYIELEEEGTPGDNKVRKVSSFKEKPDKITAQKYLDSGNYLWNAGMFVWSVKSILASFDQNARSILDVLTAGKDMIGTSGEQAYIDEVYPNTEKISVDYAILERADNVYTIPSDIGWSDLGTWNSLHDYLEKDDNLTVTLGEQTYLINTSNCIIRSDSKKVVVIKGLEDYIVVDEPNALLIYPKGDEQEIKAVVKSL
jgi:mannose-1-phosphate guanylyltransferase